MKKYKAIWKVEPTIEISEGITEEEIEELKHDRILDITMNPHDYIGFVEFEEIKS